MAKKELFDEARVRALPAGSELALGPGDLVTPAALDAAFERGIRVVRGGGSGSAGSAGAPAPAPSAPLWGRMLAQEGTYVVQVKGGRASVTRLTESGPVSLGEGS